VEKGSGRSWILTTARTRAKTGNDRGWLTEMPESSRCSDITRRTASACTPSASTLWRKLKPEIPAFGNDGIPLRDEIELTMTLA